MKSQNKIPIYLQISTVIIREIRANILKDGDRLPTEKTMAHDYGVSVTTLRKSLLHLEKAGFLRRVHGSGNYICAQGIDNGLYAFFKIELCSGGGLPAAKVLDVQKMPKPNYVPQFGVSIEAFRIRRLRFLNNIPIAVEEIWLDASYATDIRAENLSDSLYLYYKQYLQLWIMHVEDKVHIGVFPAWSPNNQNISVGKTSGFVERFSWDQHNHIAEYSRTWFSNTLARYVARIS